MGQNSLQVNLHVRAQQMDLWLKGHHCKTAVACNLRPGRRYAGHWEILPLKGKGWKSCILFFGGLQCVGHSFAYVAHFVFLRDVWIRTQRPAVAIRRATNLATHLPRVRSLDTGDNPLESGPT